MVPYKYMNKANVVGQRGFTLIELLAVMLVIAVMALASMPVLRAPRDYTVAKQDAERRTEVAEIAQAVRRYVLTTGTLPTGITNESQFIGSQAKELPICAALVPGYLKDMPSDPVVGGELTNGNCANGFLYTTGYTIEQAGERSFVIAAPYARTANIRLPVTVN